MSELPEDEYAARPCHRGDGGTLTYLGDEYNGLSGGGDYEKWECSVHGTHWFMLPD